MTSLPLSYKFTAIDIPKVGTILRPLLPVQIAYKSSALGIRLLVDSGADLSMLPRGVAESLRIPVGELEPSTSKGIGDQEVPVGLTQVTLFLSQGREHHQVEMPVQVVLEGEGPPYPLLGRDPFFREFDVAFRMGYTDSETKGKFTLTKVTKRRDAHHYK